MAKICLDHDVSRDAAKLLAEDGHEASTAWDEGLARATDDEHLLLAAQHGQIFVTHNHGDFFLLHDAWRRWSAAWQVDVRHAGILVIPQWPAGRITREVDAFLQQGLPLPVEAVGDLEIKSRAGHAMQRERKKGPGSYSVIGRTATSERRSGQVPL